jgi:hypothetical protein
VCDSIFERMINVCFESGDILGKHFESCNYIENKKTTLFDLVTNTEERNIKRR